MLHVVTLEDADWLNVTLWSLVEVYQYFISIVLVDNTVQQILDNWMLWLSEYAIIILFGPQNTKIILKFIG